MFLYFYIRSRLGGSFWIEGGNELLENTVFKYTPKRFDDPNSNERNTRVGAETEKMLMVSVLRAICPTRFARFFRDVKAHRVYCALYLANRLGRRPSELFLFDDTTVRYIIECNVVCRRCAMTLVVARVIIVGSVLDWKSTERSNRIPTHKEKYDFEVVRFASHIF